MDMDKAIAILGINRTREGDIAPMVRALGMCAYLNTDEQTERWHAGRFVLKHWAAYQRECNRRRGIKTHRK